MTASSIQVTQGTGTRLATNSYTEGGQTVHDEKVIAGEQYLPTYVMAPAAMSVGTANDHLVQIMAGASLRLRIRRIRIQQSALAAAAATGSFVIQRVTTAGTGGTAATPTPLDPSSTASGATAMTLPTVKGTEGAIIMRPQMPLVAAQPAIAFWEWVQSPNEQPLIVAGGTSNGFVVKTLNAYASAQVVVTIEFDESSF